MECQNCHGPMTRGSGFWICLQCGETVGDPNSLQPGFTALVTDRLYECLTHQPSVLAIPLQEYAAETHPVMKLHRLCDGVEILTRFLTFTAGYQSVAVLRAGRGAGLWGRTDREVLGRFQARFRLEERPPKQAAIEDQSEEG